MGEYLVSLDRLGKTFPGAKEPALAELSAGIRPGLITGLVGPDGAGKTTLMRLMAGLLAPGTGRVIIHPDPADPASVLHPAANAAREFIGYMPQKFGLYEDLSVRENLELHADLRGVLGEARERAFRRLLAFTGLARFEERLAGKLSGGMKQKLGLACALLGEPRLLLLDEPGVGVDPISRRDLWQMVRELASGGITVVWSTAYLDEAELCAEVLLLNRGRLLFAGKPGDLTARVAGRCVQLRGIGDNRREVLARALHRPEVMDGVIQGHHVRLLLREKAQPPDPRELGAGGQVAVVQVPPRFEDAFIDLLGGGPGGDSPLVAHLHRNAETALPQAPQRGEGEGDGANSGAEEGSASESGGTSSGAIEGSSSLRPGTAALREKPVVEAADLTKLFGSFAAADHVTFSVRRGEIFGLLGPNGAGKSTTFRMLCGLLTPTSGAARVAGIDLRHSPGAARQRLGYMAQKFSLYGNLTVRQNLAFFSGAYGLRGRAQAEAVNGMVDTFKLGPLLGTVSDSLPLGFKQRLALACALMHEPAILFLDEPTSGVDPVTRREFWNHINGLVRHGVTVVVTTHFMDEAEYCDRIGLVFRGRMIAAGTPDQLKAQAATPEDPDPNMEDAFIELVRREAAEE